MHANPRCTPATAYASQERLLLQTILPQGLPTFCLILQSMCANECVGEDILRKRQYYKTLLIVSVVALQTVSADPGSCHVNQETQMTELAKLKMCQ